MTAFRQICIALLAYNMRVVHGGETRYRYETKFEKRVLPDLSVQARLQPLMKNLETFSGTQGDMKF